MRASAATVALLCVAISGCASRALDTTAREQAGLTLSMMAELDEATQAFETSHARSIAYLNRATAEQLAGLQRNRQVMAREQAAAAAVADDQALAIHKRLGPLLATLERNEVSVQSVEELEVQTRALLKPLPRVAPALADSKKAVATLIEGVPPETRVKELKVYVELARESLKDAKARLAAPEAAASSAAPGV